MGCSTYCIWDVRSAWCHISHKHFFFSQGAGDHHFFSRKFEAIVNQAVITQLDTHLYGEHPRDTPSLDSYWENVFHADDAEFSATSARFSVYSSFLRISRSAMQNAKGLGFLPLSSLPVTCTYDVYVHVYIRYAEYEITFGHWQFSGHFSKMANQRTH